MQIQIEFRSIAKIKQYHKNIKQEYLTREESIPRESIEEKQSPKGTFFFFIIERLQRELFFLCCFDPRILCVCVYICFRSGDFVNAAQCLIDTNKTQPCAVGICGLKRTVFVCWIYSFKFY